MKFINVILLVALLSYSWCLIKTPAVVPQSIHVDLQRGVKNKIINYIDTQLPMASDIKFHSFYTEIINSKNMKAHFTYSFVDSNLDNEKTTLTLTGYALLKMAHVDIQSENYEEQRWSIDDIFIPTKKLEYHEPLKIKSTPTENIEDPDQQ